MRLSGISGFATTNFCKSKKQEKASEPKLYNPHNFKIEPGINSRGKKEYYIQGYDVDGRQVATLVTFNNEGLGRRQKALNETLKSLYEQSRHASKDYGYDDEIK